MIQKPCMVAESCPGTIAGASSAVAAPVSASITCVIGVPSSTVTSQV